MNHHFISDQEEVTTISCVVFFKHGMVGSLASFDHNQLSSTSVLHLFTVPNLEKS